MTGGETQAVHYIPIVTTVLSAIFSAILLRRYASKGTGLHLLWWGCGIAVYGLGTAFESAITLFGNSIALTKGWYIAGALLGGYPLAQGSVYLLMDKRTAHRLTAITVPFIVISSILVIASPVNLAVFETTRPSGAVLGWSWIRLLTPFINLYAVAFLVGGAIYSAWRYWHGTQVGSGHRAAGNALIAFGATLPGIGGTMAKAGMVEALYVGEFVGLLFIWAGFEMNVRAPRAAPAPALAA
ncbi:MAG: hypothetical protein SFV21_11995 [Rhodospirillaceae bacterium]|nr:hypothetical protein [Rhodospirillaceae bacterium]